MRMGDVEVDDWMEWMKTLKLNENWKKTQTK